MMLCAAPVAMAQAGADGPLTLSSGQMDQVTAGQASGPLAAAAAVASAMGQFTFYNTSTTAYVTASAPDPLSGMPGSYTTASGAKALAMATGQGTEVSASTTLQNEQPLPSDAVMSNSINFNLNVGGTAISVQSQVDIGGYNIYRVNQAIARVGTM
jgi:hypothetical protein